MVFWKEDTIPYTEFLMCHPSRIPRSRDPNNLKKTVASELLKHEIIVVHARNLLIVRFYATNEVWRSTFQLLHQFEQHILKFSSNCLLLKV
uniref:Putative ovule protein n=1 Tax=Solanum chacoense TaxID=4108 RepID=A0A0V0H7X3_SOLCH